MMHAVALGQHLADALHVLSHLTCSASVLSSWQTSGTGIVTVFLKISSNTSAVFGTGVVELIPTVQ